MNKLQSITKLSSALIFIAAILASSHAYAQNATLNGVEISASNASKGYEIVLNTDAEANVQKSTKSDDTLLLNLKNTKISKDTNTVYKNADGIEHVILKPEANNLEIEINGEEAASSNIKLNNEVASADLNNTVFINRPLNSYRPVTEEVEEEATSSLNLMSLLRRIKNSPSLNNLLHSSSLGWMVCVILMLGFFALNNRKPNRNENIDIRVTDNSEDKENKLLKEVLSRKEGLIAESTGLQEVRPQRRIQPQPTMQKTNYGLKAYKQNDGVNRRALRSNNMPMPKDIFDTPVHREVTATPQRPVMVTPQMSTATATKQELQESTRKNEMHIDNVKFLESMAKIYEKSGRVDLANGLANNIKKAKNLR